MARFDLAVGKVLWLEGGYVDDPDDPGGETKYGISKRAYPHLNIKELTREQAVEIYREDYWRTLWEKIEDQETASELLDFAVVAGAGTAVGRLQRALNIIGAGLAEDGILGPATLAAINAADPVRLLREFRTEQIVRAVKLGEGRPALKKFLRNWIWRAIA